MRVAPYASVARVRDAVSLHGTCSRAALTGIALPLRIGATMIGPRSRFRFPASSHRYGIAMNDHQKSAWRPSAEDIATSNVNALIERLGVQDYDALLACASAEPDRYWKTVLD